MFELYIGSARVATFEDETVSITKQVRSLFSIGEAVGDYTQSFNVVASAENNAIFNHYYDISLQGGYNAHVKVDATIMQNTLPVFEGVVELLGVSFKDGEPEAYQIVFYGSTKSLAAIYGEKTLQDVDWSAFSHQASVANIEASWSGTLLSGAVKYPVWDYHEGVVWGFGVNVANNIRVQGRGFAIDDFRPAMRLKDMVEAIINDAGFNLESGGLLSHTFFDHLYTLPVQQAGRIYDPSQSEAYKFNAENTTPQELEEVNFEPLTYTATAGNTAGALNTGTGEYTAAFTGQYDFRAEFDVASFVSAGTYTPSLLVVVYVNGTYHSAVASITITGITSQTFTINVSKGDVIQLRYSSPTGCMVDSFEWELTNAPYGMAWQTIKFKELMPKMKVTEFLNRFLGTFNAIIEPRGSAYAIVNADSYYDSGKVVDLTGRASIESIEHKKMPIPKVLSFSHEESKDVVSVDFAERNARAFGSMSFNPSVDFSEGELKVQSPFGVVVPTRINKIDANYQTVGVTDLDTPILLGSDNKPTSAGLVLFFMDEANYINSDAYYALGSVQSKYPHAGVFSDFPANPNSYSAAFSLERDVNGEVPTNTIYSLFWSRYIARLFARGSRRVSMMAHLPVSEWLNLEMRDTIRVGDYYYKIEQVVYNMQTEEAQLNLFTYTPVQVGAITSSDGAVSFPSDYTDPPTENLIFSDVTLGGVTNTSVVSGSRFVGLNQVVRGATNTQSVLQSSKLLTTNQFPKHSHMEKLTSLVTVSAVNYTVVSNYDNAETFNGGVITADATNGRYTASVGVWVYLSCAVSWEGHDKLKVALLKDGVVIKSQEVFQSSGSITLNETTYLSDVSRLELGLLYTSGGVDKDFTIQADFEIIQTP